MFSTCTCRVRRDEAGITERTQGEPFITFNSAHATECNVPLSKLFADWQYERQEGKAGCAHECEDALRTVTRTVTSERATIFIQHRGDGAHGTTGRVSTPSISAFDAPTGWTLTAATVHIGDVVSAGHYVTYAKVGGTWKLFDDSKTSQVSIEEVDRATSQAVLLSYTIAVADQGQVSSSPSDEPPAVFDDYASLPPKEFDREDVDFKSVASILAKELHKLDCPPESLNLVVWRLQDRGREACWDLIEDSERLREAADEALVFIAGTLKRPAQTMPRPKATLGPRENTSPAIAVTEAPPHATVSKLATLTAAKSAAPPSTPKWIAAAFMSHGKIRKDILPSLVHGHNVRIRWSIPNDAGTWIGVVDKKSSANETVVHYSHFRCGLCEQWHRFDEQITFQLPKKEVVYYDIVADAALPRHVPNCSPERDETTADPLEDDGALILHATSPRPEVKNAIEARDPRATLDAVATVSSKVLRGNAGVSWFIHAGQPAYVHDLTWKEVTEATRTSQRTWIRRIKSMPRDLAHVVFSTAIIELVLRYAADKEWKWSTIASHLSCVKSALRSLAFYTTETSGIDLSKDITFVTACRNAQKKSREHTTVNDITTPLTKTQFDSIILKSLKTPSTHLLAVMSWFFAARVGDMAQVRNDDVVIKTKDRSNTNCTVGVTFRWGKGAAFWGPYTIVAKLPISFTKALVAAKNAVGLTTDLFSPADQARLSRAMKQVDGCDLRSIRRGSLMHNASLGVDDKDLQLLSGHRRTDTLMRYLGWGVNSSTAATAAARRASKIGEYDSDDDIDPDGSGIDTGELMRFAMESASPDQEEAQTDENPAGGSASDFPTRVLVLPPKMGRYSGRTGHLGQRVASPPSSHFLPSRPPSTLQLGIVDVPATEWHEWPLHVKDVGLIDWGAISKMTFDKDIHAMLADAKEFVTSDRKYGIDWAPLAPSQVPFAKYRPDQITKLIEFQKIEPVEGDIRSFANGWPIPQPSKVPPSQRPIFEPYVNAVMDLGDLMQLSYPSRLEHRAQLAGVEYAIEFDFAAFYDQIELHKDIRSCFVIRVRNDDGSATLYQLTRLPMGVRFAVGVAQAATWAITAPIAHLTSTCIDNVRIASNNKREFTEAVKMFLQRCDDASITINGREAWRDLSDEEIAENGRQWHIGPSVSLGEEYSRHTVRNAPKSINKLAGAFELVKKAGSITTRRRFAAMVGLIIFMAHTINVGLWQFFKLLRCYARVCSPSSTEYGDVLWDEPMALVPAVHSCLTQAVEIILMNRAVPIRPLLPPSRFAEDYDTIIIVDAAAAGWGAYVKQGATTKLLIQGWSSRQLHSAHAEPRAATAVLQWLKTQKPLGHIALVTDHSAMPMGQRRWWSGYCGFSPAHPLNELFLALYGSDDLSAYRRDIFFVEGEKNPADGPSRRALIGQPLTISEADIVFPDLSAFTHPYMQRPERKSWQV